MGRRIFGFLIGSLICALVFAVIAIQSRQAPPEAVAAPKAAGLAQADAVPEARVAAPEAAPAPDEPVMSAAPAPVAAPPEEAPVVAVDTGQPSGPEPGAQPRPEPTAGAPLKKPGGLAGVAPTPQPQPDPGPKAATGAPAEAAPTQQAAVTPEPEPKPASEEIAASEPAPMPEPDAAPDTAPGAEPQQRAAAGLPAPPVIRRSRLPVVSDDTSRSGGIGIGRPVTSDLPSVTAKNVAPDELPSAPSLLPAPATTGAKRLTVQKTGLSQRDKVAILTLRPDAPEPAPASPRAIDRYGVLFDAGDKPLMSIILVDVGNDGVPLNAAATLKLPVSFAVAVDRGDAALAARTYFENGHEVLALSPRSVELSLSGGQTGEQVAKLLTEFFSIIPQAVGLLDVPEATFQNDRVLSNHVLAALHDTGHGLVTYEQGLNVVRREAEKAEVPAGLIYRALDRNGESIDEIKRHLDRAANEASRNGHVLVIGSTKAETIEAIQGWAQTRAARTVTLAPVSASLKQN